jgi:hypothetical protein
MKPIMLVPKYSMLSASILRNKSLTTKKASSLPSFSWVPVYGNGASFYTSSHLGTVNSTTFYAS